MHEVTTTVSPGGSGGGTTWNFGSVTSNSNSVYNYTAANITNTTYPSATIAVSSSTNDISYYNSNANELLFYGGVIESNAIKAIPVYTTPAIHAAYPMSLNTTSTAVTGGSIDIITGFGTIPGTFTGTSISHADGSGTLVLPGGTFTNVLRISNSQTLDITTSLTSGSVLMQDYSFYTPSMKAPLFTIQSVSVVAGAVNEKETRVRLNKDAVITNTVSNPVGLNLVSSDLQISVFPNPAQSEVSFNINSSSAQSVSIYDITGKLVETQKLNGGKIKLDVSAYHSGLYMYSVKTADQKILKSGKLAVSH